MYRQIHFNNLLSDGKVSRKIPAMLRSGARVARSATVGVPTASAHSCANAGGVLLAGAGAGGSRHHQQLSSALSSSGAALGGGGRKRSTGIVGGSSPRAVSSSAHRQPLILGASFLHDKNPFSSSSSNTSGNIGSSPSPSSATMSSNAASASSGDRTLTLANMNPCVKKMEYAVRGPLVIRAVELEKELQKVKKILFTSYLGRASIM